MKPYTIYGDVTCGKTLSQFMDALKQPFVVSGSLMPDAHAGYSLPIGGVMLTEGAVVPAWVGYDIGCGVTAWRFNIKKDKIMEHLQNIYTDICEEIPLGGAINDKASDSKFLNHKIDSLSPVMRELFNEKAVRGLCSLGGGNHFIEIGFDKEDNVCLTIHSGSRGFGHSVATHHMTKAAGSSKPLEGHFAYTESVDIAEYMADVSFTTWYAQLNRYRMALRVKDILTRYTMPLSINSIANCVHNDVTEVLSKRFIHRKGATIAMENQTVLIPANMRDGVIVGVGLGNRGSLFSCSHGAGRALSRSEAKKTLNADDFKQSMSGIVCCVDGKIDEAPDAYKNIDEVMNSQSLNVQMTDRLIPLINVKG